MVSSLLITGAPSSVCIAGLPGTTWFRLTLFFTSPFLDIGLFKIKPPIFVALRVTLARNLLKNFAYFKIIKNIFLI